MSNEFDRVVDALPGVAFTALADGNVDYVNQGWCAYTGRSANAATGSGWLAAVHPDDLPATLNSWREAVRNGEPYRKELRLQQADGGYRWFVSDGKPMRDNHDRIIRWWVVSVDIDEHKRDKALIAHALAEVSASEDRLSNIINAIPGFVWSAAPDGSVGFVNQRWCDYTGMSLDEARGNGWARSVHPDDAEQLARYWGALLRSGEAGEYEARLRRFDGDYRWFLVRAVPQRDEWGAVLRWYGENTDIEDRKRAEMLAASIDLSARFSDTGAIPQGLLIDSNEAHRLQP
jgi:hypothetical protein